MTALKKADGTSMLILVEKGIYRRELCSDCTRFENPQRKFVSYYD